MKKKVVDKNTAEAEKYLEGTEEGVGLFEVADVPPSRIRALLVRAFGDYFAKKINEGILIAVGGILHELQVGTWDSDQDLMTITCGMSDFYLEGMGESKKKEREKLYKLWYEDLKKNQTVSVSLPTVLINKFKRENQSIQEFIKEAILKSIEK